MNGYPIQKSWLTERIEADDPGRASALAEFGGAFRPEDELWHYDEPAPPGVNAGAMGIALVRDGEVIAATITGIH